MNKMSIHQPLKRSLMLTLLLLALLTGNLMTMRAAAEPLDASKTDEASDAPMAWPSPPQPGVFDDSTAPLNTFSRLGDSVMHAPGADAENVEYVGHIGRRRTLSLCWGTMPTSVWDHV